MDRTDMQGEVESIALMKAKAQNEHEDGLLEYLEDIIGTTKYKQPIEDANKEVEELNDQRGEKVNRLRVVEREKSALEDKKKDAEDYLRDSNELTRKKSLLWQFHMLTASSNLEITAKAIVSYLIWASLTDRKAWTSHSWRSRKRMLGNWLRSKAFKSTTMNS
jgi:structural maintenance of chromosome 4